MCFSFKTSIELWVVEMEKGYDCLIGTIEKNAVKIGKTR